MFLIDGILSTYFCWCFCNCGTWCARTGKEWTGSTVVGMLFLARPNKCYGFSIDCGFASFVAAHFFGSLWLLGPNRKTALAIPEHFSALSSRECSYTTIQIMHKRPEKREVSRSFFAECLYALAVLRDHGCKCESRGVHWVLWNAAVSCKRDYAKLEPKFLRKCTDFQLVVCARKQAGGH